MLRVLSTAIMSLLSILSVIASGTMSYNFEHLTTREGLSHDYVSAIAQDSTGMMWLGTKYGLNSYDGSNIRVYKSRVGDENTLVENQIRGLIADQMVLYMRTFNYLTIYDIVQERFTNISLPNIASIDLQGDRLWVATRNSILSMDVRSRVMTENSFNVGDDVTLTAILACGDLLYLGSEQGVFSYNTTNGAFSLVVDSVNTISLFKDRDGRVWVSTRSTGLFVIDEDGEVSNYTTPAISHRFVRSVCQDKEGNIWVATIRGLDLFDPVSESSVAYSSRRDDPTQLSHSSIWSLYCSRDGVIWAGTYFAGVNILDPSAASFRYYAVTSPRARGGEQSSIVAKMVEDEQGNIYIGTYGGGLNYFDPKSGEFTKHMSSRGDPTAIGCNNIQDIYQHSPSELLIATHTDGMNLYDVRSGHFRSILESQPTIGFVARGSVGDIEPYGDRYLLSTNSGIYVCDVESSAVEPLVKSGYNNLMQTKVLLCCVDSAGQIWIGSETSGVFRYNPRTGEMRQYIFAPYASRSLSSNEINSIYEDEHRHIWICTPSGLDLYNPVSDDFDTFNHSHGLPSSTVCSVVDAHNNSLLVTTSRGVSSLSLSDMRFQNFTALDGMPLANVSNNSLLYTESGYVYVGGDNGMISFFGSDRFREAEHKYHVLITALRVGEDYLRAADSTEVIDRNIVLVDDVVLSHEQNNFTIYFSDMSMTNSSSCSLEYMLDGFDKEFVPAMGESSVTYRNLPYKKYRFYVRCANASADDPKSVDTLDIRVKPPLYLSTVAFLLYLLIFIVVSMYIMSLYYGHRVTVEGLRAEKAEHQRDREYDQSRLEFFTNISHELRTPLSLISGQLEYILDEVDDGSAHQRRLAQAFDSAKRLQSMVDEFVDLRKQQNGYTILLLKVEDIGSLVREVYGCYGELANYREIDYKLDIAESDEPICAKCDRNEIEKVLFNLLTNAFKFTSSGSISVGLFAEGDEVVIEVRDSGIGIEASNQERIFEQFYQEQRGGSELRELRGVGGVGGVGLSLVKSIVEAHGGVIEVESVVDEGSCFRVRLSRVDAQEEAKSDALFAESSDSSIKESILLDSGSSVEDILSSLNEKASVSDDILILIVEDNAAMRGFLVDLFSKYYLVESACDGEEGYQKCVALRPSLILSDVVMPNVSGVEMCTMVKQNPQISYIPVVLLTEHVGLDQQLEGISAGADDYISKPFSIKLLLARVESLLESRKALQEHFSSESHIAFKQLFTPNAGDEEFLTRAFNKIVENISNESYTVDQFASDMFMGRTTFFKRLKEAVEMTPNEFILTVRLKRAIEMLKSPSNYLIADIADKCGFNSQQYFCSCFKRKFGVSPAQYAKEAK